MEPLMPSFRGGEISKLTARILMISGELRAKVRGKTRSSIEEVLRTMNCYYSNLIEGVETLPRDIERALKDDFSNQLVNDNYFSLFDDNYNSLVGDQ